MSIETKYSKILLVDDDIDLLEQNKLLLESKGFAVTTAESGMEGYELFLTTRPDAVIVDLIMEWIKEERDIRA